MDLGERLKKLREEKGYSIEDLAVLVEMAPEEVSAWEEDSATPDAKGLMRLSRAYGISIDSIVYEENSVPEYDESKGIYGSDLIKEETAVSPEEADKVLEKEAGKAQEAKSSKKPRKKMTGAEWLTLFVFPVFCVLVYLCLGIFVKVWHPTWLILVLVPLYFFLYFFLRSLGSNVDSAVEEYISERENQDHENYH